MRTGDGINTGIIANFKNKNNKIPRGDDAIFIFKVNKKLQRIIILLLKIVIFHHRHDKNS